MSTNGPSCGPRGNSRLDQIEHLIREALSESGGDGGYAEDVNRLVGARRSDGAGYSRFISLPFLCCQAVGGQEAHTIPVAAAWHLLTVAAHLLDDIEDRDLDLSQNTPANAMRRLNQATGLIFASQLTLTLLRRYPVEPELVIDTLADFQRTALDICAGQDRDLVSPNSLEDTWQIITAKGGKPFALACRAGARVGGGDARQLAALGDFGLHVGMMNQIGNDISGIWSRSDSRDLLKGRKTLPVQYVLTVAPAPERERLQALYRRVEDPESRLEIQALLAELGALHYVMLSAELHRRQALVALDSISPSARVPQELFRLLDQASLLISEVHDRARALGTDSPCAATSVRLD